MIIQKEPIVMDRKSMDSIAYLEKIESLVDKVEDWSVLPKVPIVSVWMITYNHEAFIGKAIEGVLMQQTAFPYELVIGDDHSTDKTREIVRKYQERYPERIRLRLAKENLYSQKIKQSAGVFNACRGKYVALCEGDDYWTNPLKLQKQVDFLESHFECSMCFHDVVKFYQDGSKPQSAAPLYKLKSSYSLEDLLVCNFIRTASVMYRNGLVDQYPDSFHALPMGDWPRYILLAERGQIGYLNQTMAAYRVHSGGIWSSNNATSQLEGRIDLFNKLRFYLGKKYNRLIAAQLSLNYLELASVFADEGDLTEAKTLLMKSCVESQFYPFPRPLDKAALFARLYLPILYQAIKKAWPSLGMRKNESL